MGKGLKVLAYIITFLVIISMVSLILMQFQLFPKRKLEFCCNCNVIHCFYFAGNCIGILCKKINYDDYTR